MEPYLQSPYALMTYTGKIFLRTGKAVRRQFSHYVMFIVKPVESLLQ